MTSIVQYRAAPEFSRLAPSSKRAHLIYIKPIEDVFGDLPLARSAPRSGHSAAFRRTQKTRPLDRHLARLDKST